MLHCAAKQANRRHLEVLVVPATKVALYFLVFISKFTLCLLHARQEVLRIPAVSHVTRGIPCDMLSGGRRRDILEAFAPQHHKNSWKGLKHTGAFQLNQAAHKTYLCTPC